MVNAMMTQPTTTALTAFRFALCFPALRSIHVGLCVLLISCLPVSIGALTATAQPVDHSEATAPSSRDIAPGDTAAISALVQTLTSPVVARRDRAFHQIRDLARRAPEIDLSAAVPSLVNAYINDPHEKYRLAAVVTLYLIGDETGMQQVRQRFVREPSLTVQYVSVATLLEYYGPGAFDEGAEGSALARNVLARKHEAERFVGRRHLQMLPRVVVGPLEVVEADSLQ